MRTIFVTLALLAAAPLAVCPATPSPEAISSLVEDYLATRPAQPVESGPTMEDALRTQQAFVEKLIPTLGKKVGYKVGLVTRETQERYGVSAPIRGVLLSKMLLPNGADLTVNCGVRPLVEADLMVVVKDNGINRATTTFEVARHLKEVVAFIEVPDLFVATNRPVDGRLLTAINAGARLGVLGGRLPVQPTTEFVDALASMTVRVTDQTGAELASAPGRVILDQPLHAVLWLLEDLRRTGDKLKRGDLISLGSLSAIPPRPGQTLTVRYQGLPGGPIAVSVKFR